MNKPLRLLIIFAISGIVVSIINTKIYALDQQEQQEQQMQQYKQQQDQLEREGNQTTLVPPGFNSTLYDEQLDNLQKKASNSIEDFNKYVEASNFKIKLLKENRYFTNQ